MRIYITASLTGKKYYEEKYLLLVSILKSMGHEVISDHLFNVSALKVREENKEQRLLYLKHLKYWLSRVDLFIAETSYPSTSVGFEISKAVDSNVPTLVLYTDEAGFPPVMYGLDGEKLLIEAYSEINLRVVIENSINFLKSTKNQRFTMLMPPVLLKYLSKVSHKGINRSEYIRKLIYEDMKRRGE